VAWRPGIGPGLEMAAVSMTKFLFILALLIVVALGGGIAYLLTVELPAPTTAMEKPIPNDRLAQ
jgi:hypothetical protein